LGANSKLSPAFRKRPATNQVTLPRSASRSYNPLDLLGPNSPQAILPGERMDSDEILGSEGVSIGSLVTEQRRECES